MIETDKANLAVESPFSETLVKVVTGAGETVQVGDLPAYVGQLGKVVPPAEEDNQSMETAEPAPRFLTSALDASTVGSQREISSPGLAAGKVLTSVEGTAPGGRIELEDVRRAAAK